MIGFALPDIQGPSAPTVIQSRRTRTLIYYFRISPIAAQFFGRLDRWSPVGLRVKPAL